MREQREPWLNLPAKEPGSSESPRVNPRFRTHVVKVARPSTPVVEQSPEPPRQPSPRPPSLEPQDPEFELSLPSERAEPSAVAIERAAAAAAIATSATVRLRPRDPRPPVAPEAPRPAVKPVVATRAASAPVVGLDDLTPVTSADWVIKVGEAARMVDVVVVFYTAAYRGSAMFEYALNTVVNEVLPRAGRPYTVYRFSLDDEPGFVPEMAVSLGLPPDNPVTAAGFSWSGPGRRLFLIGDRALESQSAFQRVLRQSLRGEPPDVAGTSAMRSQLAAGFERSRERAERPWSGRALVVIVWCLFGSAALGAIVIGVAPQWASALLHPETPQSPAPSPKDPARSGNTQGGVSPSTANLGTPAGGSAGSVVQSNLPVAASPVKSAQTHVRKKRTPASAGAAPTYWGLPEIDPR